MFKQRCLGVVMTSKTVKKATPFKRSAGGKLLSLTEKLYKKKFST